MILRFKRATPMLVYSIDYRLLRNRRVGVHFQTHSMNVESLYQIEVYHFPKYNFEQTYLKN